MNDLPPDPADSDAPPPDEPGAPEAPEAPDAPNVDDADDGGRPADPRPAAAPRGEAAPEERERKHVRCFLAINFPLATVRRIADEVTALKGPVAATGLVARWVPAANLHLTLKFLGWVRPAVVEAIAARLRAGLPDFAPFDLEAVGLGAFPTATRPRVLWVGVREAPALAALQQAVEGWMEELGFPREARPYSAHVTIGRVASGHGDLSSLLAERAGKSFGGGRVTEVVIYESRMLGRGAEYHALGRVPLSA